MPVSFDSFKPLLVPAEGGYGNAANDPGGETKYGISKHSYPNVDIKNLTLDDAFVILKRDFWDHYGMDRFISQDLANKMFLALINENPYSAIRCFQRAINHCGGNIIEDGLMGVKTISCGNSLPQGWLLDRFRIEEALFYCFRVTVSPSQMNDLHGWINRALC